MQMKIRKNMKGIANSSTRKTCIMCESMGRGNMSRLAGIDGLCQEHRLQHKEMIKEWENNN